MSHTIAVIGGGPAGLRAAEVLADAGCAVTVFDHKPSVGRKFLIAGRGGLNLTHSEPLPEFLTKYGAAERLMARAFAAFSPSDLIAWCHALGIETFVGTSGRVFPACMKATPLLRAWLKKLNRLGVTFALRRRWTGWDGKTLLFEDEDGQVVPFRPDASLVALGGASWAHLGSDGHWAEIFRAQGIPLTPFRPANCGFEVSWSDLFKRHAGEPLKPITLTFAGRTQRGEIMITRSGVEGSLIYAFGAVLRDAIETSGKADIVLDLRPDLPKEELIRRLSAPRGHRSLSNHLRKAVSPLAASLLREGARDLSPDPTVLAKRIKAMPLTLVATAPLKRAISSAGGVCLDALTDDLMLKDKPGVFVAGEMLDWEAPTGGYLLQGCFSTATLAARGMQAWLAGA